MSRLPIILTILCVVTPAFAQNDLAARLKALPNVLEVKEMVNPGSSTYDITFQQPVDHKNPGGGRFGQHVYLAHKGFDKPVLLNTEGYAARGPQGGELQRMLAGPNLITVEHRYFGKSIPSPIIWEQLTIKNAADDMHAIVTTFKKLYSGKWVSTGVSKGGQTSLFFKCYYPNDVDATVAYVAPLNVAQEDPRIYQFLDNVGDPETRTKIRDLQIAFLKRQDEIIPLLNPQAKDYPMGVNKAFEYGVLEFPFALWQYGTKPTSLPAPGAPASDLADAYKRVNAMYYYSDAGIKQFEAFIWQAFSEIGYYNYDITDFKPYIRHLTDPTNKDLAPAGTKDKIVYNPATLQFVYNYLQYKAQNVIFIYGETDPWSATQMQLIGRTNAIKLMVKGAWHNANVRQASPEQKELFYTTMEKWLGMPLVRV
ncbi:MAG: S28 family serine protease [Fimbriimonas sp.]